VDERGEGGGLRLAVPDTRVGAAAEPTTRAIRLHGLVSRLAPVLVSLALVAPSLVFDAIDRSIWRWDDSWYGEVAVDLWAKLRQSSLGWWHSEMVHAFGIKPPAIAWIGQFFVPLHGVVGSVEVALKLSVVLAQAGVLLLLWVAGRRAGAPVRAVLAGVLLVAASPLFVDLSHWYMVEEFQAFAVAWALLIMVSARRWHPSLTVAQIVAAASFGLLVKISTPVYMAAPVVVALALSLFGRPSRRSGGWWREPRFLASAAVALVLAIATGEWYATNWSTAIGNTEFSTSSRLLGVRRGFATGVWYWLGRLGHSLFLPWFDLALVVVLVAGCGLVVLTRRRLLTAVGRLRVVYFFGSVGSVLASVLGLATQVNDQDRFLLAGFPCLGLALALLLAELRVRVLPLVCVALLAAQFGLVTDWSYSPPRHMDWYFAEGLPIGPPAPRTEFAAELDRIVRLTCTRATAGRSNIVGVDYRWLNHNNLELLAHARYALGGRWCGYSYLGLAETDPARAWAALRSLAPPFFIGVDYGNPRNPLPAELVRTTDLTDAYNRVNVAVFERLLASHRYRILQGTRRDGLLVLRARPLPHSSSR
jgi:dolichyl-phosphate-mannose-protein mannosyltransferase